MSRLPRLTAKEIVTVLEKTGFSLARQSGSHKIYKHSSGKRVTVPFHGSKILHPKVLKSILKDAGVDSATLQIILQYTKDL